ncbi:MAG TPA: glycoside hydrolase family 36 protein [Ktedonobacterales bacterium]|jgi:alpha-galactosidase
MSSAIRAVSSGWELQNDLVTWRLTTDGAFSLRPTTSPSSWLYGTSALTIRLEHTTHPKQEGLALHRPIPGSLKVTTAQDNYADSSGTGVHLEAEAALPLPGVVLLLHATLYQHSPLLRLHIGVSNSSQATIMLEHLIPALIDEAALMQPAALPPLSIADKSKGWASYHQGWQSWSYAGSIAPGKAAIKPKSRTLRAMHQPFSSEVSSIFHSWEQPLINEEMTLVGFPQSLPALLVGFLRARDQAGQVMFDRQNGRLAAISHAESHALSPGESLWAEPVALGFGEEQKLLEQYARHVSNEMQARHKNTTPAGWCSWYYYFTRVTEQDILENLSALSDHKERLPLQVIQIDDGYQTAVGDWTSVSEKFPGGMPELARRIREHGFQPGLWLAPFTATARSQLAQQHPDWLLHTAKGQPTFGGENWGSTMFGLDCTHPQVQEWLRRLFGTLVESWGYDYLKLDFLYCAALPGIRYLPHATSVQALRSGLEQIRSSVGEDVFLLGCGCPLLPAIGLVDAMRIGPDVAPTWEPLLHGRPAPRSEGFGLPSALNALRNSLTRAWMHPAFWINDPDCLLIREQGTDLSLAEIQTLASVIGLTGGMLLLSDPMQTIADNRWNLPAILLPPLEQAAQPLSWLDATPPDTVLLPMLRPWGSITIAGLFNWDKKGQRRQVSLKALKLPPGRYHITEFWTQRYLGIISELFDLDLAGHGAAVLLIQPATDQPALLSTDFHLSQGARELDRFAYHPEEHRLAWGLHLGRTARGTQRLYLPGSLQPGTLTTTASETSVRPGTLPGEYLIQATISQQATFSLQLEV